jgi:hypothetical protein
MSIFKFGTLKLMPNATFYILSVFLSVDKISINLNSRQMKKTHFIEFDKFIGFPHHASITMIETEWKIRYPYPYNKKKTGGGLFSAASSVPPFQSRRFSARRFRARRFSARRFSAAVSVPSLKGDVSVPHIFLS